MTANNVTRTRSPRKPVRRTAQLQEAGRALVLRVGQTVSRYRLTAIAAAFGLGYRLDKLSGGTDDEADHYHVNLSPADGCHTCECKGWLRWQTCKHVDSLNALLVAGCLPVLPDDAADGLNLAEEFAASEASEAEADAA